MNTTYVMKLTYLCDGQEYSLSTQDSLDKPHLALRMQREEERLIIDVLPKCPITLMSATIETKRSYKPNERLFVNGYQSWTDSREFGIHETLTHMAPWTLPIQKQYKMSQYGDYTFKTYSRKPGEFHGFTYCYMRDDQSFDFWGSLSERQGYTVFDMNVKAQTLCISKDCQGLEVSSPYRLFDLFHGVGSEAAVFDQYFALMNLPAPVAQPATGWTSWYHYYQDINEGALLENIQAVQKQSVKLDYFQIDDGFQTAVGDWLSIDATKFPNGMKPLAQAIRAGGMTPGLWLAPFVCEKKSELFRTKPHWLLKDAQGHPVPAGANWSSFYALDIDHPEVRAYLKDVFKTVVDEWGFKLLKLDFLYGVCLLPRKDKTRGQIMCEAMDFLREIAGDALILGCGVPLGPAFGKVDYCRIGADIGLDWNGKFYMKYLVRERVSTYEALHNAIGRRQLNGRAFQNDPDVFLLRDQNLQLTATQKKTLALVNHLFGSLLFTSDPLDHYSPEQGQLMAQTMDIHERQLLTVNCPEKDVYEVQYVSRGKTYGALINLRSRPVEIQSTWIQKSVVVEAFDSQILVF